MDLGRFFWSGLQSLRFEISRTAEGRRKMFDDVHFCEPIVCRDWKLFVAISVMIVVVGEGLLG